MNKWSWAIGNLNLEVRSGNILEAAEPAWVNPENSGFQMAAYGRSVSAQLLRMFPESQRLLDLQTRGAVFPEGSVLMTQSSGPAIFHVGHHHPMNWLVHQEDTMPSDIDQHATNIEKCIAEVLERVVALQLEGVAFPMIGTGEFAMPLETFARVFFATVADFGRRCTTRVHVALVVWEPTQLEPLVRIGTRVLASMIVGGSPLLQSAGGHPLLESLRGGVRTLADPLLQEQLLLRFAEIGLHTTLVTSLELRKLPLNEFLADVDLRRGGFSFTFGYIRDRLERQLRQGTNDFQPWFKKHLEWLDRKVSRQAMRRLTEDRNHLAHNRSPRPIQEIVNDVEQILGPKALPSPWPIFGQHWIKEIDGEIALADGVQVTKREMTWLMPLSRRRRSLPI